MLVLFPRWTVDERLPEAERKEFTPTPKQLLYGQRAELIRIVATEKDEPGRVQEAFAEVELKESSGGDWSRGFVFPSINRPLEDGKLYTLDPCPNDWYGTGARRSSMACARASRTVLYDRLLNPSWHRATAPVTPGQAQFLAGLGCLPRRPGLLHDFENGKRDFIGGHGADAGPAGPRPAGHGESYSTAFAVFARLQGAMQARPDLRVFVSCKTHAATDVLLKNVLDVQEKLAGTPGASRPDLFASISTPACWTCRFTGWPRTTRRRMAIIPLREGRREGRRRAEERRLIRGRRLGGRGRHARRRLPDAQGQVATRHCSATTSATCLVLDEASQMNLPEAMMAALPLKADGQVIVVGDHRQMPPIVKHDWENEFRRTFQQYRGLRVACSIRCGLHNPPMIQFAESFRLHATMAEFLRQEIYRHDGIDYHSKKRDVAAVQHDRR